MVDYEKVMNADGTPTFDPTGLPPLKPCPKCGEKLEYWAHNYVVCTSRTCPFDKELKYVPKPTPPESAGPRE